MKYTHHKQTIDQLKLENRIFWTILVFSLAGALLYITKEQVISPCPDSGCGVSIVQSEDYDVDNMVDTYSYRYGKTTYERNRIKAMIHYLLLREQNYGGNTACGDGGLACGPLQYHQSTYTQFRQIMMKRGLVKTMGSRLEMKDAIETTAWAISDGRENNWGPVLRKEIKI